jgi:broad specificity phosphatase PhoE
MPIFLLRHAESEFNAYIDRNKKDCNLSPNGRLQAQNIPKYHFDIVFCSPMKRAKQTLNLAVNITYDKLFEWDMIREIKDSPCDFFENEPLIKETQLKAYDRVNIILDFLYQFIKMRENPKILLVGHSVIFRLLTNHQIQLQNAEIRKVNLFD